MCYFEEMKIPFLFLAICFKHREPMVTANEGVLVNRYA